jgi:hypothetical protein
MECGDEVTALGPRNCGAGADNESHPRASHREPNQNRSHDTRSFSVAGHAVDVYV